jgi:restriction system protein
VPLLAAIDSLGGVAKPRDLYPLVAQRFPELSPEELTQTLKSSPSTRKWWNLVQWVRQHLVELGELDGSTRGVEDH